MTGLVVGILVGLALALIVALYVTKVPVPFIDKVPQRSAEQEAQEAERNRNWDPNAPLATAPAARGDAPQASTPAALAAAPPSAPAHMATASRAASEPSLLSPRPNASAPAAAASAKPAGDAFTYFVQVGAWQRNEDAEQARARLAMSGLSARITEREQAGRTMYRVRLGPFSSETEADEAKSQAVDAGFEAAAKVSVQR
jgi:cell division protein FtsN